MKPCLALLGLLFLDAGLAWGDVVMNVANNTISPTRKWTVTNLDSPATLTANIGTDAISGTLPGAGDLGTSLSQ